MSNLEFVNEILATHNKYRTNHQAPDLKISDKLNKIAQEWAENLAKNDKAEHRPQNPYGENIYMAGSTDPNWKLKGETVVKSWYDEIKLYKFGEPSPKKPDEVGHFTQLVWKGTTDLGIGEAKSKAGRVYVVCNYDPPGNVLQEFGKNVLPSNKPSQNGNDNGPSAEQAVETDETGRERIALTASQEKLGIRLVQPNVKIVESMERLYAVSSEKIRVWSVWLTKVEEEANEWNSWLRSHINLVLRMAEYLRRAEETLEKERNTRNEKTIMEGESEEQHRDRERGSEVAPTAADVGHGLDEMSRGSGEAGDEETDRSDAGRKGASEEQRTSSSATAKEVEDDARKRDRVANGVVGEEPSSEEPMEKPSTEPEKSRNEKNDDEAVTDRNGEKNRDSMYEESGNEGGTQEREKIVWPIGVPWEPVEPSTTEEKEIARKKNDEVEVIPMPDNEEDMQRLIREVKHQATIYRSLYKHWLEVGDQVIPMPGNEEDMQRLIREVKHQATIYRSLYKHWLEVGDRAIKEITNRTVMPSEQVITDEEIPYFFYLYVEPDIDIGIEHDEVLLPDMTREKITCEFTPLYFNLADKPGKG